MAKRKDDVVYAGREFYDEFVDIVAEETATAPETVSVETVQYVKSFERDVRILNERETTIEGVVYVPVVTCPEKAVPVEGFLVPKRKLQFTNDVQSVDLSDAIPMYSWDAEISKMLDNYEAVLSRIRLSIWRTGAFFEGSITDDRAAKQALSSAFPYRLIVEDK